MNDVTIRRVSCFSKSFLYFLLIFFFYRFAWRTKFPFVYLGKLKR